MYFVTMLLNIGFGSRRSVFLQALGDTWTQKTFQKCLNFSPIFGDHQSLKNSNPTVLNPGIFIFPQKKHTLFVDEPGGAGKQLF